MLEAAVYRAKVLGDLPGAIQQLEAIVARYPGKPVAGQALVEIGQAEELLGHHRKALAAYRRVLTDYPGEVPAVANLLRNPESVAGAAPGPSGLSWESPPSAKAPSARCCMGMVYDKATRSTVFFGGFSPFVCFGDTWIWKNEWRQLTPASAPQARTDMAMTYDGAAQNVVLFGGADSTGKAMNDTWTWDGATWTKQSPPVSPPPRKSDSHGMAYDASNRKVVLFGGVNAGRVYGDTWLWDGRAKTWTQPSPSASPSARRTGLAYDEATQRVVLFGGHSNGPVRNDMFFGDTWTWDGTNWTKQGPAAAPSPRGMASMFYDPGLGALVLFGGVNRAAGQSNETWLWNGVNWREMHPSAAPATRFNAGMTYDAAAKGLLLFGGFHSNTLGDTWILKHAP